MSPSNPRRQRSGQSIASPHAKLKFRLYIAGQSPRSLAAIANLERICRDHSLGRSCIEVIDLMANPALASRDQIVAIPTLVRLLPKPIRIVIGDLSNTANVLAGLEVSFMRGVSSVSCAPK